MKRTPLTTHCNQFPFVDSVYPPSEDTYLLLDGLELDLDTFLIPLKPTTCLEIGSGSGCVSTFLAMHMNPNMVYITTDINPLANRATQSTAKLNCCKTTEIDCITTDLVTGLRLVNQFDLVLFNPPYVPTPNNEVGQAYALAYAGGFNGMSVTARILPLLTNLLSPNGVAYFVFVFENGILNIKDWMRTQFQMDMTIVIQRKCQNEHLFIARFQRQKSENWVNKLL